MTILRKKNGDLVRCYRSLVFWQTTKRRATQLVFSLKFKLSQAMNSRTDRCPQTFICNAKSGQNLTAISFSSHCILYFVPLFFGDFWGRPACRICGSPSGAEGRPGQSLATTRPALGARTVRERGSFIIYHIFVISYICNGFLTWRNFVAKNSWQKWVGPVWVWASRRRWWKGSGPAHSQCNSRPTTPPAVAGSLVFLPRLSTCTLLLWARYLQSHIKHHYLNRSNSVNRASGRGFSPPTSSSCHICTLLLLR